jgi:hypothetical protein
MAIRDKNKPQRNIIPTRMYLLFAKLMFRAVANFLSKIVVNFAISLAKAK